MRGVGDIKGPEWGGRVTQGRKEPVGQEDSGGQVRPPGVQEDMSTPAYEASVRAGERACTDQAAWGDWCGMGRMAGSCM